MTDEIMERAFADVADALEAQYAADEQAAKAEDAHDADVLTVWNWIQERGGETWNDGEASGVGLFVDSRSAGKYFKTAAEAAEWIRAQEAQR